MFLHLGENITVKLRDIIGIFPYEGQHFSNDNRIFLRMADEDGFVVRISKDPPKSYIIAEIEKRSRIYLSPISARTLIKRAESEYDSGGNTE